MDINAVLVAGDLSLDLFERIATRGDKASKLTNREFHLLKYLMERKNQICSLVDITNAVWKKDVGVSSIAMYISYLRLKIDDGQPNTMIENIFGEGYRLIADEGTGRESLGR